MMRTFIADTMDMMDMCMIRMCMFLHGENPAVLSAVK